MNQDVQYQTGVYIMTGTLDGDPLIKVGKTTVGVDRRLSQLNADCYAGISDWRLHTWFALDNARLTSAVEKIIHDEIERFNVPLPNGAGGMATEVFDLTAEEAADALTYALSEMQGYITLEAQLVGGSEGKATTKSRSPIEQIVLVFLALFLLVALSGCAISSQDVKSDPGRYEEAVVPMSLDEIEIAIYEYVKLCGHGRVHLTRDREDPKAGFWASALGDRVLKHYEYEESPDGSETLIRCWSHSSWDDSFKWAIHQIENPDQCIGSFGVES